MDSTTEDVAGQRGHAAELAALQREFPGFRIWREAAGERTRLVAVRRHRGLSPHTVVTGDLAELRAVLTRPPVDLRQPVTATAPGRDEITVTAPGGQDLCNDRAHRIEGRLAEVVVTFGQLGEQPWQRESLWPECWGRSYPMCGPCWDKTRQVAIKARPALVIRDL